MSNNAPITSAAPASGFTMTVENTRVANPDSSPGDPFGGDCHQFTLTKPVDLGQLTGEIVRRLKPAQPPQLVLDMSDDTKISATHPVVLWIGPARLNRSALQDLIKQHVPASPPEDTTQPDGVGGSPVRASFTDDQQKLVARLQEGDSLDASECSNLLKAMLGIS